MENKGFNALKEKIIREEKEKKSKKAQNFLAVGWCIFVGVIIGHIYFGSTMWMFEKTYDGAVSWMNFLSCAGAIVFHEMARVFMFSKKGEN